MLVQMSWTKMRLPEDPYAWVAGCRHTDAILNDPNEMHVVRVGIVSLPESFIKMLVTTSTTQFLRNSFRESFT